MQEQFLAINNELTNLSREYSREHARAEQALTELKRTQTDRERLIAELEVKNAELERFTYTASHDLKSPLITIQGFLELLEKDSAAGNAVHMQQDIQHISTATQTMQRLLDELLQLSRIGRVVNPPQAVPLGELIDAATGLVAGQLAERGVAVTIAPELPIICGDRPRLVEVLQNLLDNAIKCTGEQPAPQIIIGGRPEGAGVTCYVQDNGIGIDPRYHDKIFGLFERLDPHGEGTGIGLALVKRIIEAHGGRIWVESKGHGHGCTFFFCLPTHGEKALYA